jgi:hypothetical protein
MVLNQVKVQYKPRVDEFFIYVQQSEPSYKSRQSAMITRDFYKQRLLELVFSYMFSPNPIFELVNVFRLTDNDKDIISESILEKMLQSNARIPNDTYQLVLGAKPAEKIEDPELQAKLADFEDHLRIEYRMVKIKDRKKG